jgi:uncharacterized delta-60 repeat protein
MKKLWLLLFSNLLFAQAVSYDTSFSGDGIASYCFPAGSGGYSTGSAFQSTGKIVTLQDVGVGDSYLDILRFNSDGSIDNAFGNPSGFLYNVFNYPFEPNSSHYWLDIAVQNDDKIIIAGLQQTTTGNKFWLIRLTANGILDTSFNTTGYLSFSFGSIQDGGRCVAIQTDGKIIVAGRSGDIGQNFAMARINSNGSFDTTFGIGGKVQTTFTGVQSGALSIAFQPDGKIVLGGWTTTSLIKDFALIRYNSNGTIDTTFGANGKVVTAIPGALSENITKLLIQSDGKILAGGTTYDDGGFFCMSRYNQNGSLDTSFGSNGIVISSEYGGYSVGMAQQIDGKIILVGGAEIFSYIRYLNNGEVDTTFPVNGFYANNGLYGYAYSVLIQPNNKIVIVGSLIIENSDSFCTGIVRLNPGTLSNNEFVSDTIIIYPNPTSHTVFIDNSVNQYVFASLYNSLGQGVKKVSLGNSISENIDISDMSSGVYLVKFENKNTINYAKIVKQ